MIFDRTLLFSNAQAITATAESTDALDLLAVGRAYGHAADLGRDVAKSTPIPFLVQVVETFDTAGEAGTLQIDIELDSTETFTPDKTIPLGTFLEADLVAGFKIPWSQLPEGISYRYMRLKYTVASGPFTAGKITAGCVLGVQTN
jgi:hypothetical protein